MKEQIFDIFELLDLFEKSEYIPEGKADFICGWLAAIRQIKLSLRDMDYQSTEKLYAEIERLRFLLKIKEKRIEDLEATKQKTFGYGQDY